MVDDNHDPIFFLFKYDFSITQCDQISMWNIFFEIIQIKLSDFWTILITSLFKYRPVWLLLGHLLEKYGLFLFQHLVTLDPHLKRFDVCWKVNVCEPRESFYFKSRWWKRPTHLNNEFLNTGQCDQIGRFIGLWANFYNNWFAQITHNLRQFL